MAKEDVAKRNHRHGATVRGSHWPEYAVWRSLIARCYNPRHKSFDRYGGRGITVCKRWLNGTSTKTGFDCFISDVGRRPAPNLQIERVNNNGNYTPKNCTWATAKEQAANRLPRHKWKRRKT